MSEEKLREAIARGLFGGDEHEWHNLPNGEAGYWFDQADAALAALAAIAAAGLKLLRREPTVEMCEAAQDISVYDTVPLAMELQKIWRAMHDAAPAIPAKEEQR